MNKKFEMLAAPVKSLYSKEFYKSVPREKLGKGFLYIAYISLILTVLSISGYIFRGLPQIDNFVEWVKADMPRLTWTPEGLIMNEQSPYDMIHPEMAGFMITFDTTRDTVTYQDMGNATIFFTATRAYLKQGEGQMREYVLTRSVADVDPERQAIQITPDLVESTYSSFKPIAFILITVFSFPYFYVQRLILALVYSLFGMLINLTRREKFSYTQVLNLSFFTMTAATFIQFRGVIHPALMGIPFGPAGSFLMTIAYMVYAIKFTEDSLGQEQPPA